MTKDYLTKKTKDLQLKPKTSVKRFLLDYSKSLRITKCDNKEFETILN